MRPNGSASVRLAGVPARSTFPEVYLSRRSGGGTRPNPGPAGQTPGEGAPGPGRSPLLFGLLFFGLPLALIILVEILRS